MRLTSACCLVLMGSSLLWAGIMGQSRVQSVSTADPEDPVLHIGILQRFGEDPQDTVSISAPWGSELSVQFADGTGKQQTLPASTVTLSIVNRALTTPELEQRLILSSHKSFESAEASAIAWEQEHSLSAEVAQPGEWQVWAHRSKYSPRDLEQIYNQFQSIPTLRLVETEITEKPLLSWVIGDFRYNRDRVKITSKAGYLQVGRSTYAGSITVKPNAYGSYTVINQVPLETYLRGVVPHEIGPGAPQTAIEAQAILARTYALRNTHRFKIDGYHLCADTHCQVYKGLSTTPQTDAAIEQTKNQVLTYNNDLIDAVYSSTNGGVSAAFEDIWDGDPRPYLRSVPDITGATLSLDLRDPEIFRQFLAQREGYNEVGISKLFRWEKKVSLIDLTQLFKSNQKYLGLPLPTWDQIDGLKILSRAVSGRVQSLQIDLRTPDGIHVLTLEKDQIRLVFQTLLSTMFDIEPILQGDQLWGYSFKGGGFGHGVGMSQYGSYGLSRKGYTTSQILNFYYPGTQLAPLSSIGFQLPAVSYN